VGRWQLPICVVKGTLYLTNLSREFIMKMTILTEDIEFDEPVDDFEFLGHRYPYWGNPNGRNHTIDYNIGKFNRYAKLGLIADDVVQEFKSMLDTDWQNIDGRCAFACLIMMKYGIRVGNEDSAMGHESKLEHTENEFVQTYGVTTLLNKHVNIVDDTINLRFLGKTEVEHNIKIGDPIVVQYAQLYYKPEEPETKWIGVAYSVLFDFIKSNIGMAFVPKDLRTFCANITAWRAIENLLSEPLRDTKTEANQDVKEITEVVSERLGNTPSIAKKNYIDGRTLDWFKNRRLKQD